MTGRSRLGLQAAIATLAASSALSSVFVDMRWLFPVAGAILLVAVVNDVTRRTPVAAALGPVVSAAAVLLYITAIDAGAAAYGRVIPTRASLAVLGDLARNGFDDIRSLAAPVPTHQGLVLLAIVGLAAVELVVDLVAVTLRRAAAAGLPLLAVFAICTSVAKGGVGWLPFGIGTAGYLWLLLADSRDRVSRWGQTLGADPSTRPRVQWADMDTAPSPLSALGRRIGATAIAVGVVVPMLIPGLHGGLPKHGGSGGDGNGHGHGQVVTLNPIVNIRAQLTSPTATPIIRMTSTDLAPTYLRLTSLDRFDGTTFAPSNISAKPEARVSKGINAPVVTGTSVQTQLAISNLAVHWLPLPTQVEDVAVNGDWRYDAGSNTVFSSRNDTKHLDYTAGSTRYEPTASELEAAGFVARGDVPPQYLELPPSISGSVIKLAQTITSKASSPFAKALAIQNYLTGPTFGYDTSVPGSDSSDALAQFLLVTKRGFCQQFSASMAVLARVVGIPSRVAVGFTHGIRQLDGTWVVTTHDAHAWPELYFPGFGWLPFEPTPRTDGQAITPSFAQSASTVEPKDNGPNSPTTQPSSKPSLSAADRKQLERQTPPAVQPVARTTHRDRSWWWLVPALLAVALPVPGLLRGWQRHRRWRLASTPADVASAAWAESRASAIDAGVDWIDGITPRAAGRIVLADRNLGEAGRAALQRIVHAEERARYARDTDAAAVAELRADVLTLTHAMTAGRPWRRHIAAVVWPRSTVLGARRAVSAFADVLDFLDAAAAKLRARLSRREARPA
jgi:hypothetical protein